MKLTKKIIFLILILANVVSFSYSYNILDNDIEFYKSIYELNINSNKISIIFPYTEFVFDLILISGNSELSSELSLNLKLCPEELNNYIFFIFNKEEINNFINQNNLNKDVKEFLKGIEDNKLNFTYHYYFAFMTEYSIEKDNKFISKKVQESIYGLYDIESWYSLRVFNLFYSKYKDKLKLIGQFIENYILNNSRKYIDQILLLNYSKLKLNYDCNLFLNLIVVDDKSNDEEALLNISSYYSVNEKYYNLLYKNEKFYSKEFYKDYLKIFEANYINTFIPYEKLERKFYSTMSHELFHLYQDIFDNSYFLKNLEEIVNNNEEVKNIYNKYLESFYSLIDRFINKYEDYEDRDPLIKFLITMFKGGIVADFPYFSGSEFHKIYYINFWTFFTSDIMSFVEFSADVYAFWIMKNYIKDLKENEYCGYEKNKKLILILEKEINLSSLNLTDDFSIWALILKFYFNCCIAQMNHSTISLLTNI